ncbi:MAG: (Fe-S)-binding protein [Deltaproteobacteria bacterium]|nr:(Fe-S)-binding protein [Deltaproteobacteria bacterium]
MLRRKVAEQAPGLIPKSHNAMMSNVIEKGNIYGAELESIGDSDSNPDLAYFAGCVGVFMEHESVSQTAALLKLLGNRVAIIDDLCCGGPCEVGGFEIPEIATERVIERVKSLGVAKILTSCPRCSITFRNTPVYREHFQAEHITEFLSGLGWPELSDRKITYHDPCELSRIQSITQEPRTVLGKIAPNLIEMPHNRDLTACCGAGGGLRGVQARLSIGIARKRLEEAIDLGAQVLLTECYSCLHNFVNARRSTDHIEVFNLSQYLYQLLADRGK